MNYTDSLPSEERDNLAEQESLMDLTRAQRKALEKKRRKAKRAKEWERLMKEQPDEKYKNPKDEEEIRVARATLGMFQLKTSSDYVVPEHMRSSTRQKRRRISLLTLQIYQKKKAFNEKVRRARDEKRAIRENALEVTEILAGLQRQLPKHEHRSPPSIPEILIAEEPENKFTIKIEEKKEAAQEVQRAKSASESAHSLGVKSATSLIDRTEQLEIESDGLSDFENFEERKRLIMTLHQRDSILDKCQSRIRRFDDDVHTLRLYKIKLEEELTISKLQLDTLLQELILLKDFEAREEAIMGRCDSKETELEDVKSKVHTSKVKLDAKQKELAKLAEREKSVQQDFLVLIGENNKFQDYLTKVFKKKIKRVTQNDKNNDEESSDEESSDDDSDWSDEDSDAEPFDDTVCPSGCSMEMFEKTIALRQKRCEIEDDMQDTKKMADTLRKDNDSLNKKVKMIQNQLTQSLNDLELFQVEKQGKLNEIWVVVPLEMRQLDFQDVSHPEQIPLQKGLVVPSQTIARLNQRIDELMVEREQEKVKFRNARHQHVLLTKGNKDRVVEVAELSEKCNQTMMLKFGRIVDIDSLELVTTSRAVEEARESVRQNEMKLARESHKIELEIAALKEKLASKLHDNTHKLNQLSAMKSESDQIQQLLNECQNDTSPDQLQERQAADREDRQKLRNLVTQQSNEIHLLKNEIIRLTRKGGHMLPPTTQHNNEHGDA